MSKRVIILILVLIILGGFTAYLIYQNFFAKVEAPALVSVPKIKTDFPLKFLENPKFTALKSHGELPKVIEKGKTNPFMKF
jgi:hypothetical protein